MFFNYDENILESINQSSNCFGGILHDILFFV